MSNEVIMSNPILWWILFFKDCMLFGIFFYFILDSKVNIIRLLIFSLLASLGIIITRLVIPMEWLLIPALLLLILLCVFVLKFEFLKSILVVFLSQIAALIGELVLMLFMNQFNIPKDYFVNNFSYAALGNLLSSLVFLSIILFIYYAKIKIIFAEDVIRKRNIGLILNVLITLFLVSPNIIFFISSSYDIPKQIILFNIMAIIIFFSLSTYNTYKSNELEIKKNELEYHKLYNKTLNDLIDGLRTFKHDFANMLNALGGYIELNDFKGLKKYFMELSADYSSVNSLSSINASIINNPSIYGVIVSKLHTADTQGIKMDVDITTDLNGSSMKIYELCKLLGILLDNAIEAAYQSKEKSVKLSVKFNQTTNCYTIIIKNTFSGQVNINEIYKKGFSTKGQDRGLGLWEIKSITNKYKSVSLRTTINDMVFGQELLIASDSIKRAI